MSNYATPDPGIIDRPYVQQIPLEALFKNLAYKQSKYDQGLQQAKQTLQAAGNINAYGQDEKVRDEMFKKLNTDLQQFNGLDLGDTRVSSQLDGLVSGFTDNGEIAGIDARGRTFAKMQREEEAAQMKGLEYYNPGLDQARKYYAGGAYKSNTRFSDDGNIAPDMEKINKEILADPSVSYKSKEVVNGRIVEHTIVDEHKAAEEYKRRAETDPRLSKYVQYKFNAAHDGTDWKAEGVKHFEQRAKDSQLLGLELQRNINLEIAKGAKANAQAIAAAQVQLQDIQQKTAQFQHVAQDPHMLGSDFKARIFDEYVTNEAARFGASKKLNTISDIDSDAISTEMLRHQNDMTEAGLKHTLDLETERAKNTLERGYEYDAKTGKDGSPLVYNPDTPSKPGKGITKAEELHYGSVLRQKYKTLTPTDVKGLFPLNSPMGILVAQNESTIAKTTNDAGDVVYEMTVGGNKFQLMTEDQFVKMHIKGSKDVMQQMEQDMKNEVGSTDATESTGAPSITNKQQF